MREYAGISVSDGKAGRTRWVQQFAGGDVYGVVGERLGDSVVASSGERK